MDKQNYTLRELEIKVLRENWSLLKGKLINELENRIFRRKRVLKSLNLLIKAIFLYITGQLSFQRLSDIMACQYGVVMSDTAWRKQILKAAPILVEWVLQQQGIKKADSTSETVLGHPDAYAIDATDLPVQDGNATSRRMHTIFSICKHCCVHTEVTDRHRGESLTRFPFHQDALYFADRAYGRTPQIACAMEQNTGRLRRILCYFSHWCQKSTYLHKNFRSLLKTYEEPDRENDWVKLAALVPWETAEERYAAQFANNGHPAHPCRMTLGALPIQRRPKCSDAWLVKHIGENPYTSAGLYETESN